MNNIIGNSMAANDEQNSKLYDVKDQSSVVKVAEKYFANLNPLAKRIHLDICEMTQAYSHLWNEFSIKEKNEVIDETFIKSEYVIKYLDDVLVNSPQQSFDKSIKNIEKSATTSGGGSFDDDDIDDDLSSTESASESSSSDIIHKYLFDEKHLQTYARLITGEKKIHDEICGIYVDEHSAPFSFKTRSQINLNIFELEKLPSESASKSTQFNVSIKESISKPKSSLIKNAKTTTITTKSISSNKPTKSKNKKKSNSKYSIASSINSQNSRKNFMSKLFSGLAAHGNDNGNVLLAHNDEEKETLFSDTIATDISDVSLLGIIHSTQGLEKDIVDGAAANTRGLLSQPILQKQKQKKNDRPKNPNEFKSLLTEDDLSKDYDFLNNW